MKDLGVVEKLNKPEHNTVFALKELLKEAEEGEIVGMVYSLVHSDGKCSYGTVGSLDLQPNRLAGAISNSLLKFQLNHVIEYIPE